MTSDRDESLGRIVLERGLLTPAQLKAALDLQGRSPDGSLAETLSKMGLLDRNQVEEILGEIDSADQKTLVEAAKETYVCPACGSRYTAPHPKPGHVHRCRKCSGVLERRAAPLPGGPGPGRAIGKYAIQGELGRGGMGVVYKAWDPHEGRSVAIKCMLRTDDPTEAARFEREARTAASLSHPNIVKVYEVGVQDGVPFMAMECVSGKSLAQIISPHRPKDQRPSMDRSLAYVRDAALALGHAHGRNIVHRDVKPQNIMVTDAGEVKVMDFGLAREMARGLTVTTTGKVIGTPQYMSPEQARGDRESMGPRTDVWALGVMLYELAARVSPFEGETAAEVLHKIAHEDALPVRKRNPRIDRDLERIVMKCLDSETGARYGSGTALAEDLSRYLDGVPVTARPAGLWRRLKKRAARRKGVSLAVAGGVLAVALLSAVLLPKLGSAKKEAAEAVAGRTQAELSMKLWAGISNFITEAEINARAGEVGRARGKLDAGIAACREFLKSQELPHARYFMGRLLRSRGKADEALRELDAAIRAEPLLGEARHERGLLKVERYQAQMTMARQTALALRGPGAPPPTTAELEKENPDLARLREEARADLSVDVGRSSYFRPVDGIFGRARMMEIQGNAGEAEDQFRKVLEMDPAFALALAGLARLDNEAGRYDSAVTRATDALRRHQGLGLAHLERCEALLFKARESPSSQEVDRWTSSALEDAHRAIALGEATEYAYYTRANAKGTVGDKAGAILDYTEAVQINPRASGALSNRGALRAQSGDQDGALEDFTASIRINPRSAEVHTNLGLTLEAKGDPKRALAEHDEAIRQNPRVVIPYTNRAALRSRMGDLQGAQADCDAALNLDPENSVAAYNRGVNSIRKGDREAALRDFDRAIEWNPRYAEAYGNRGYLLVEQKQYDVAIADLTRAIELRATPLHHVNRANARRNKGDAAGAIEDYTAALNLAPDLLAYYNRGALRDSRGDLDGAIADQTEALKLNPSFAPALRNRAGARATKGDVKSALADYDEALRIEPRHSGALSNRSLLRQKGGDLEGALRDVDEAIAVESGNFTAWNNRGNIKFRRNELDAALADYTEAIRINPRYVTAFFMRGQVRGRKGDLKGAVIDLRKALELAPPNWPNRRDAEELIRSAGEQP